MKHDYRTICYNYLLKGLPDRAKEVIARRYGLGGDRETLEAIGASHGITRERVRQIEEETLKKLREKAGVSACRYIFKDYANYLKKNASLKREDLLLSQFGNDKFQNYVYFLLTLGAPFEKMPETEHFHAFWALDKKAFDKARKAVSGFIKDLKKKKKPVNLPSSLPVSYIEISKEIVKGSQGLYGLKKWPEVNPKGVKDKAYIVLRQEEKPLHFTQVASFINGAIPQTVHNELIKDPRFVLVGRGLYALKEWGYEPGTVRDVIYREIKGSRKPLPKEEVVQKVLSQRKVKPNTVLLNLQNKKYFIKTPDGRYNIRKA